MAVHKEISGEALTTFLAANAGWTRSVGSVISLARSYAFEDYASSVAFAVQVAFAAERRHHHPNLHILWGEVRVEWWTHDTGDITDLDLEMAQTIDRIYVGTAA